MNIPLRYEPSTHTHTPTHTHTHKYTHTRYRFDFQLIDYLGKKKKKTTQFCSESCNCSPVSPGILTRNTFLKMMLHIFLIVNQAMRLTSNQWDISRIDSYKSQVILFCKIDMMGCRCGGRSWGSCLEHRGAVHLGRQNVCTSPGLLTFGLLFWRK